MTSLNENLKIQSPVERKLLKCYIKTTVLLALLPYCLYYLSVPNVIYCPFIDQFTLSKEWSNQAESLKTLSLPQVLIPPVGFMVTFIITPSFTEHFIIRGGRALFGLIREHLAMVQSFLVCVARKALEIQLLLSSSGNKHYKGN